MLSTLSKAFNKFEKNNETIVLNILYMSFNTEEIRHAYKWKYNKERKSEVILSTITVSKEWHYLAEKNLSALFIAIKWKHREDFCCLNCLHSYRTKPKLKKHYNVCKNYDYCYREIPTEANKNLKYNQGEIPMKDPFIIYADLESLLRKIRICHDNPEKSSTTKMNKHTPFAY